MMGEGEILERAVRFATLYRTWDGQIPLDDLLSDQAWYARLDSKDGHAFKVRAFACIMRSADAPDPSLGRRVGRRLDEWFPQGRRART
jgi:hypothetical protein